MLLVLYPLLYPLDSTVVTHRLTCEGFFTTRSGFTPTLAEKYVCITYYDV